ncbi:methyltransferase domain-containing protein [Dyella sp. C9]|uniref:methyltransferase domain-containing protein n=1 Tax=Dyella sp. C9 TaxID=2202154 RepID=UPI000DEF67DE|nr:methyltransferase domain-containing protein [Dyella sp. C9]
MNALNDKVAALPEIYQPIYGHPELAQHVSRGCEDRLHYLNALHDALCAQLQRPVRVLDLGCAQGYISLSLAARGATVVGVDFLAANVEVCSALAAEHPGWSVRFEHARLEDFIGQLEEDSFDLVFGLSVFHHVVHEHGLPRVQQWLDRLAACATLGVFELAQSGEPLYWAPSQPKDSRDLLRGFSFVHEIARFPTHLSDIQRPLYVASNHYWYLGGNLQAFGRCDADPHALARGTHQLTRRYFFGGGKMAKLLRFDGPRGDYNRTEWQREIDALGDPPPELAGIWPSLESVGESGDEGWLVRGTVEGDLLLDVITQRGEYDAHRVVGDVLAQLAALERHGCQHHDVRVWNTLLLADGSAQLIDYGAISREPTLDNWPDDLFLTFFIFVHEVVSHRVTATAPYVVPLFISPFNLPEPYASWLGALWASPRSEWSFRALSDSYAQLSVAAEAGANTFTAHELWMGAIERHVSALGQQVRDQQFHVSQWRQEWPQLTDKLALLDANLGGLVSRHEALDGAVASLNKSADVALNSLRTDLAHLTGRHDVLDSTVAWLNSRWNTDFGATRRKADAELERLSGEVLGLRHSLEQATAEFGRQQERWLVHEQERLRALQELEVLRNSLSFRITKPLRYMANILRKGRSALAKVVRPVWHKMVLHAWGRRIAAVICAPFPTLKARLHESITAHARSSGDVPAPVQNKELSAGSQWIHDQLQHGLKGRKSDKGD